MSLNTMEILLKEAIERELARNGQVFYLHNSVATIYNKQAHGDVGFQMHQLVLCTLR